MKSKDESALVRTLSPATLGRSGRKPGPGPRGLAVRARPPGLSAASPDTPPTPVALGSACSSRPPLEASGATSSCRLPVSEVGPAPFSAISGTSLLRPSPLRATICLSMRPPFPEPECPGGQWPAQRCDNSARHTFVGGAAGVAEAACPARLRGAGRWHLLQAPPSAGPRGHRSCLSTPPRPRLTKTPALLRGDTPPTVPEAPRPDAVTPEVPGGWASGRQLEGGHRAVRTPRPKP